MSDEWPAAPRLEHALQEEAASFQTDPAARRRLADLLADEDMPATQHKRETTSHSGRPRFLAVAAVLVVLAGAAALGAQRGQTSETATSNSPPLTCDLTTSLIEYDPGGGQAAVAGQANQPPDGGPVISFISLADAPSWHEVADSQRLTEHLDGRSSITYSPSVTAEATDLLVGAQCTAHIYVIVEGMSSAALNEFICAPATQTRGPSGLVLVKPPAPPTSCAITQPVMLVGPDVMGDQLEAWQQHLGCVPAAMNPDQQVVRSTRCEHTLVAAETTTDPWSDTIEELPASAWVLTIASISN